MGLGVAVLAAARGRTYARAAPASRPAAARGRSGMAARARSRRLRPSGVDDRVLGRLMPGEVGRGLAAAADEGEAGEAEQCGEEGKSSEHGWLDEPRDGRLPGLGSARWARVASILRAEWASPRRGRETSASPSTGAGSLASRGMGHLDEGAVAEQVPAHRAVARSWRSGACQPRRGARRCRSASLARRPSPRGASPRGPGASAS